MNKLDKIFPMLLIILFGFLGVWVSKKYSQGWYSYFHGLTFKEQKKNLWKFFKWKKTWNTDKDKKKKKYS